MSTTLYMACSRCGKRGAYWYGADIITVRCRYCKASLSFPRHEMTTEQAAARLYTVATAAGAPAIIVISDDLRIRAGRSTRAVYLSSLSGESTIMIAPDEILPLIVFLERYMDDQAGRREAI